MVFVKAQACLLEPAFGGGQGLLRQGAGAGRTGAAPPSSGLHSGLVRSISSGDRAPGKAELPPGTGFGQNPGHSLEVRGLYGVGHTSQHAPEHTHTLTNSTPHTTSTSRNLSHTL